MKAERLGIAEKPQDRANVPVTDCDVTVSNAIIVKPRTARGMDFEESTSAQVAHGLKHPHGVGGHDQLVPDVRWVRRGHRDCAFSLGRPGHLQIPHLKLTGRQ